MYIITIVAKPPITAVAYFKLHQLLRLSIDQIKLRVQSNAPIFNEEIFDNNYEEKSCLLGRLLEIAREETIHLELFETVDGWPRMGISGEVLSNIIHSKDEIDLNP